MNLSSQSVEGLGRNEPCVCGSAEKFKDCCALRGTLAHYVPSLAR